MKYLYGIPREYVQQSNIVLCVGFANMRLMSESTLYYPCITRQLLGYYAYAKNKLTQEQSEQVNKAITQMTKDGYLVNLRNNIFQINTEKIHKIAGAFVGFTKDDIPLLQKPKLFHMLMCMLSTFAKDMNYKAGYMAQSYFADLLHVTLPTISARMQELEEAGYIKIYRSSYNPLLKTRYTNLYCRVEDKDEIRQAYVSTTYDNSDEKTTNFKRSVSARYNKFLTNPQAFTPEEIAQLHKDVIQYNKIIIGMPNAAPKDLSVFT